MLRSMILFVVVLAATSASAEPLRIERLGVAYWTASETIEMRVVFDRAPSFPADYFYLALVAERPPQESEWTSLGDNGVGDTVRLIHHIVAHENQVNTFRGEFPYLIDGTTWSTTIPFDAAGLSAIPHLFNVSVRGAGEPPGTSWTFERNPVQIDRFVMGFPVPEPTPLALLASGVLALTAFRRIRRFKLNSV